MALGDIEVALRHVAPDVVCVSDGGASVEAARRPVVGADRVVRFLVNLTRRYAGHLTARPASVNGDIGSVVSRDGTVDLVTAFEVEDGRVATIRMVRNPDKLVPCGGTRLGPVGRSAGPHHDSAGARPARKHDHGPPVA